MAAAWAALGRSGYARDEAVSDQTGVGILPGRDLSKGSSPTDGAIKMDHSHHIKYNDSTSHSCVEFQQILTDLLKFQDHEKLKKA